MLSRCGPWSVKVSRPMFGSGLNGEPRFLMIDPRIETLQFNNFDTELVPVHFMRFREL